LRRPWPWIAAVIAAGLFAPFIQWNLRHDLAHLEFIRAATAGKYSGLSAWTFFNGLFVINHPLSAPLWLLGLAYLLFSKRAQPYRPLGIAFLVAAAIFAINGHSKSEYLSAGYPAIFAAGGAAFDLARKRWIVRFLKPLYAGLLIGSTLLLVPLVLPVLRVDRYIAYAKSLGVEPSTAENQELGVLPQFYADMFGWRDKAMTVANVFDKLTDDERARCAIFSANYGRCGAIDFFGRDRGLPHAIGPHNSYWTWGPGNFDGSVVLVLGHEVDRELFESTELAATVPHDPYCMPYEDELNVFVCRNLRRPLTELWPELRHYQ
jgi:hypothetical protein